MDEFVRLGLMLLLLIAATSIIFMRNVFASIAVFGIYSFLMASIFSVLAAPDVALTEAVVGAGIATVLMLAAFAFTHSTRDAPLNGVDSLGGVVFLVAGALLLFMLADAPPIGSVNAVNASIVAERYVEDAPKEIGVPNLVTAVLASYRGYDTLGELTVIFTAATGVLLLLGRPDPAGITTVGQQYAPRLEPIRTHPVARIVSKIMIPIILLFALYVQFFGEYGPGGGFQAGVLVAVALILYQFLTAPEIVAEKLPNRLFTTLLAGGLLLYLGIGVMGPVLGGNFLDYSVLATAPLDGQFRGIFWVEAAIGLAVAAGIYSTFRAFTAH